MCKHYGDDVTLFLYRIIVTPLIMSSITLKSITVWSSWVPINDTIKKHLISALLGIARRVIWLTRIKVDYRGDAFSPHSLVQIFCYSLKVCIKAEKVRLSLSDFTESWMTVAHVCSVSEARIDWYLDMS